jgi:hypothetical protein
LKREQARPGNRCKARNKRGDPCAATAVGARGYCVAHDPERKVDMRELGHRGGKAGRKGVAEQLPETERASLREQLRRGLDPAVVVAAANDILAGENQSARTSMVRFLSDLELYRREGDECPKCTAWKAAAPDAAAKFDHLIERHVEGVLQEELGMQHLDSQGVAHARGGDSKMTAAIRRGVRRAREGHEEDLQAAVEAPVGKILDSMANGLVLPTDVSAEECERVLRDLEEAGLLVPRGRVETLAEELAQERLTALKQEHGLVGV